MKLTSQVIEASTTYTNPSKQATLQLRNSNLTIIDEWPTSYNYDALDLTNNNLIEISLNEPLPIRTLVINGNNEFHQLSSKHFPFLESLSIMGTNVRWEDFESWKFPNLKHFIAIDTPLSSIKNYRILVIKQIPSLEVLDFEKVKQKERLAVKDVKVVDEIDEDYKAQLIEKLKNTDDLLEIERIERILTKK
ncbi:U2 small nuclear ribonucleoprotein A' [[Candida] jaroonii]|uniref:U2 small nuclear ribonucleoprotein A n=1 Tax=[Candida] jaroonii TaxID=467808 RepID=A0ACA9Y6J3_9ASCO|nr:U2 small nuclear ribonucleoprotein A' [[Candida] jaroonii]